MLYGNVYKEGQNFLHPTLKKALDFLKNTDFSTMEPQKIAIDGDNMYATIMDIVTEPRENKRVESHAKYIDIQFSPNGGEIIGTTMFKPEYEITEDLLEEKDNLFYKEVKNENFLLMNKGNYVILFPSDLHRPGCAVDAPKPIRKVVIKVAVDLLQS